MKKTLLFVTGLLAWGTLFVLLPLPLRPVQAQPAQSPEKEQIAPGFPFERYFTTDKFNRRITFYLSTANDPSAKLPLIVFIQGSGCFSHFVKRGERIGGGIQMLFRQVAGTRARILVVEKPGVKFLDESQQPGAAEGCSQEFLEQHALPRWTEAVDAAIRAALQMPGIDASKLLVTGHSEGGDVAAHVAALNPRVTHAACLATGGPTQLFDLAEFARTQTPSTGSGDAGQRVFDEWKKIEADPDSTTKFWMGHPYRRWSSFLKTSAFEALLKTKARIYLAHGTKDQSVPVIAFDALRADLIVRGRDVTVERIEGGDHGFFRGADDKDGMKRVINNVVTWFLDQPGDNLSQNGEKK